MIDTGFTGNLKIPEEQARELGLLITHSEEITLADQHVAKVSAGIASVVMEGVNKTIEILVGPGFSIMGVGLMKHFGYNLHIDFKYDLLTLERGT